MNYRELREFYSVYHFDIKYKVLCRPINSYSLIKLVLIFSTCI